MFQTLEWSKQIPIVRPSNGEVWSRSLTCSMGTVVQRCSTLSTKSASFEAGKLFAAHVRTNHVHVVIDGEAKPEKILNDLKSYASRRLNRLGFDLLGCRRWAHHGSTRWLWQLEDVLGAIRYVVDEQGEPMSVFVTDPELMPGNRPRAKEPTP